MVTFLADEFGGQINDVDAPLVIFDDEINEALKEVFIVVLTLENATNPDGVVITRAASLGRIIDNDGGYRLHALIIVYCMYVTKDHNSEVFCIDDLLKHQELKSNCTLGRGST